MRGNWLRLDEDNVLQEQLRLMLRNVREAVLPASVLFIVTAWALADGENWPVLAAWCLTVLVSRQCIGFFARYHQAHSIPPEKTRRFVWTFMAIQVADGLIQGALPWLTLDATSPAGTVLVITVLVGGIASVLAQFSPILPVFYTKALAMLAPLIVKLWEMGDPAYHVLAFTGILYLLGLSSQARANAAMTRKAISLGFRNQELFSQLEKEAENARAQSQRAEEARQSAEEANLAKSKFLATVSHDLRQPIHAQGLFLEVLGGTELTNYQSDLLKNVRAGSEAAVEMLNALLDFSRIEAGVMTPNIRSFRLQPLLNKIEREFAPQADALGLHYRSRETNALVRSDPTLVELILRNLVSNAIRYTQVGGVLVACRQRGNQVLLMVYDTGIGIAPDDQKKIFREFQQLGNPERNREKGLGLGLAIVDRLARTLGHALSLESRQARGSAFGVRLPLAYDLATEEQSLVDDAGTLKALEVRLLVIDNDEKVRTGMAFLLRDWGCKCETAASIEEAQAIARAYTPDLVISDYHLDENQNGIDAITKMRKIFGHDLPALLITGDTTAELLREMELRQEIPLLHKPVSPLQLYRCIVSSLRHRISLPGH